MNDYKYVIFIPSAHLYLAEDIRKLTDNITRARKFSIHNPIRFMLLLRIKLLHPDAKLHKVLELRANFNIDLEQIK